MPGPYLSRRALWHNKLAEQVVGGIVDRIRAGDLAPGAALPDRATLAAEFVTTLSVIDRALERLEEMHLASPDAAGIWHVAAAPPVEAAFAVPSGAEATLADVISVMELRIPVESEAAALAAERRSDSQLEAIRAAAAGFDEADAPGTAGPADFRFHLTIADATENPYFRDLIDYIGPLLVPRMRLSLEPGGGRRDENLERSRTAHAAIVEAIAAGDPEAARAAMQRHLKNTLDLLRQLGNANPNGRDS